MWFAREPAKSKARQASASKQERQAGRRAVSQGREAARERSASKRTLPEMVSSTPGILLLPILICLQHCINVNGKSQVRSVCVCYVCVCVPVGSHGAGKRAQCAVRLAKITLLYTCLGCSLKEWPCLAAPGASQPCVSSELKEPLTLPLVWAKSDTFVVCVCVIHLAWVF